MLGVIVIIGTVIQNYRLAKMYLNADGKTRAMFGITELVELHIKFYLGFGVIIGLFFAWLAKQRKEKSRNIYVGVILNLMALCLLFIRIWRLMI
jgi:hypothetical protein